MMFSLLKIIQCQDEETQSLYSPDFQVKFPLGEKKKNRRGIRGVVVLLLERLTKDGTHVISGRRAANGKSQKQESSRN